MNRRHPDRVLDGLLAIATLVLLAIVLYAIGADALRQRMAHALHAWRTMNRMPPTPWWVWLAVLLLLMVFITVLLTVNRAALQ